MDVRDIESYDDAPAKDAGKVALLIEHSHYPQHYVTLEELLELRAAIDRYLFLRVAHPTPAEQREPTRR